MSEGSAKILRMFFYAGHDRQFGDFVSSVRQEIYVFKSATVPRSQPGEEYEKTAAEIYPAFRAEFFRFSDIRQNQFVSCTPRKAILF